MTSSAVERDVILVLAFLNTLDAEGGTDVLDDPVAWRHWVHERGLGAPGASGEVRSARDALRAAAAGEPDGTWPGVVLTAGIEQGVPALADADAVAGVLAAAVRIAVSGDWDRIKICPADDCRWAFYDRSRNRSRTWCSMQVCGNRQKARSWRARARDARA